MEKIICSAVIFGDKIVRGHRHADCIHTAHRMGIDTKHQGKDEGFITSENRWVDRTEARQLHKEAGQVPFRGKYEDDVELFSEDLY